MHEEVNGSMLARVNEALNERDECMTALNARRRLRMSEYQREK